MNDERFCLRTLLVAWNYDEVEYSNKIIRVGEIDLYYYNLPMKED